MSAHTLRETSTPQPPMSLPGFLQRLGDTPQQIEFSETMEIIDAHYGYTPTAFRNGDIGNAAGQNAGSCKLFAFARLQGLSERRRWPASAATTARTCCRILRGRTTRTSAVSCAAAGPASTSTAKRCGRVEPPGGPLRRSARDKRRDPSLLHRNLK